MKVKLILGPPGTGKTTRLLSVLEEELKLVSPNEIAFVSFTKKGTYEGRDRALQEFKLKSDDLPYFKTLHSLAFRSAGLNRSDMIGRTHYRQFSEATQMKFTGFYTEDLRHDDDRYLFFNSLYRNNPSSADKLLNDLNPKLLRWITKEFKRFKEELCIYDFTDIIQLYLEIGKTYPVKVAIIDEAQDLTTLQWKFVWKAFARCERVYIAGDDDQAIYEWSGADVNYFLNIKGDNEILNKSWRLPSEIHSYALKVSDCINKRIPKQFDANKEGGSVEVLNNYKEVPLDNQSSWMFLARNNYHLKGLEKWLQSNGILYYKKDKLSYDPKIIKAISAHTKICRGKTVPEVDKLLCSALMDEGMENPYSDTWYNEFTVLKPDDLEYYRNIISSMPDRDNIYVRVSTIHGVKGGQADKVVLLLSYNKSIETNYRSNQDSEMRCYYVAVTRAKEKLYLVLPEGQYGYQYLD